ncbi:Wadjet anti-phage system protein JetA family protein [Cellvibrio sp. UBA7661]|uniref:Wadjet anti-phage system protein JetA family protein n=1 Tax=Cellvibrio sp. UBA7661 TaxID=1946311 RepID=UPI0039C86F3A
MFFSDSRQHFFNPLTGKYRELVSECLRLLYQRLYTDLRDYGHAMNREQLVDIFKEAIARAPILDADTDTESGESEDANEGRFKTQRDLASFIINRLIENGWLEKQVDETSLQSSYGFSRMGRLFTQPFADNDANQFRTRNRNTRNTRNSLQAFYDQGEINDLLDAYEYSERIISDFTDVIAELEERKRQLVREVESRQLIQQASDEFFDFMETVFKPDLEVRLSADSVEKYRDQIADIITKIRRKRKYGQGDAETAAKDWRAVMEIRLRKALPQKVVPGISLLETLLQTIDSRLKNACDIMLPALRRALNTFTQRADIIIRQLSYINSRGQDDLMDIYHVLGKLSGEQQDQLLLEQGESIASINIGFVDPAQIQLRAPRTIHVVRSMLDDDKALDVEAQKNLFIQQALDKAFILQSSSLRDYVHAALIEKGHIRSSELKANSMQELLNLSHAIEVGAAANLSSRYRFEVDQQASWLQGSPLVSTDNYFTQRDEFIIRLIDDGADHE